MPGPKKTPTKVLEARGSWLPGTRKDEPKAPDGKPPVPRWISKRARDHYRETCKRLDSMGLLSTADRDILTRYAVTWDRWREAAEFITENGLTFVTREGRKPYPEAAYEQKYSAMLHRYETALGLTPSARAGLGVVASAEKPKGDAMEAAKARKLQLLEKPGKGKTG